MSGIYHSWNGTVLTVTSDSGTSSADLQGVMGIRGPQGIAGKSSEDVENLKAQVNGIEESLNGYVDWEGFYTELDGALSCYPSNDELWGNYYTKEEIDSKNPLIITVDGSTPSATNAEIYEAAQNGRGVYLFLWGNTYLKATYISTTAVWFEATYLSNETINDKTYDVVKYRLFIIDNNKYAQKNSYNLPRVESLAEVEKRVNKLEKPYELIQSITTTEDTKAIEFNSVKLDKFALYADIPMSNNAGGVNLHVYKGAQRVYAAWIGSVMSTTKDTCISAVGRNENGIAFVEHTAANSPGESRNKAITPKYIEGINPFTKIGLVLGGSSTYSIPTGTKVELWGVKR